MSRPDARIPEHPEPHEITLQAVLEALVDPVRRSIAAQLHRAGEDISCGKFDLPVARSTATHHFGVLREAGVIRQYYVGTSRMNTLRADDLNSRFPGLLDACLQAETTTPDPEP
ncbi:ArsR/SmtB family transcription factor [Streptomyces specialis]|uniref:ArsR/SmtB family transcription factor n=1 Tax=Streptomyces specialis TaxID=498367 RepID=UPI00073E2CCE|nr:helix-turn-helix transcriptional regulator [Streptomyces specialis]